VAGMPARRGGFYATGAASLRRAIVRKYALPGALALRLAEDERDGDVRRELAAATSDRAVIERLLQDRSVHYALASRRRPLPEDLPLRRLAQAPALSARRALARRTTHPAVFEALIEDAEVLPDLIANHAMPGYHLSTLAEIGDWMTRAAVARAPVVGERLLQRLAGDLDRDVRVAVAKRGGCPDRVLQRLRRDPDRLVQRALSKRAT